MLDTNHSRLWFFFLVLSRVWALCCIVFCCYTLISNTLNLPEICCFLPDWWSIFAHPPNAYHRQCTPECWLYRNGRNSNLSTHLLCQLLSGWTILLSETSIAIPWNVQSFFAVTVTICFVFSEWYGYHFPELIKIVSDNSMYCRLAQLIGNRKELSEESLESLEELVMDGAKAQAILDASRSSMG